MGDIRKILKKLVSEGYKLKAQHSNKDWKDALENAESLLVDKRSLDNLDDYYIDELVDIRRKARDTKNWELADRLRDYLDSKSVIIMDSKEGQVVYYELKGGRSDLIKRLEDDKRAIANHEAWVYSMLSGSKKAHKVKKSKINKEIII